MVIYLDIAFLLNALADALALYGTARLTGLPVQKLRLAAAAALGGTYGEHPSAVLVSTPPVTWPV